ncbi:MAG: glycoside hydrolase family 5 protein [Clostridium sp.]|jgi:hypothetical protein|nr:glycoside hydrolase family 5 protein [Clostridium sp.]
MAKKTRKWLRALVGILSGIIALLCVLFIPLRIYAALADAPPSNKPDRIGEADFLQTDGKDIVNRSGERVYLRGTNAGAWLIQERWQCPTNALDQSTARQVLAERFGEKKRDELFAVYESNYWQSSDFDNCAAMGMSVLRLPFPWWELTDEDGAEKPGAFTRMDWFVESCAERGIYVILDLHAAYGSQNGEQHSGLKSDGRGLYGSEENRAKTLRLWEMVAEHYAGNPAVAAYDLLNEPDNDSGFTRKEQWDYYDELYRAVRAVDSEHIIMLESCWFRINIPNPEKYEWENVVYEYHQYARPVKNSALGIQLFSEFYALEILSGFYDVPVFIGEFTCFAQPEAWEFTLRLFNSLGWHWATWSYKCTGVGDSAWGIYNQDLPKADIYLDSEEAIRAIWSRTGTEASCVTRTQYADIIQKFLQDE